MNTIVNEREMSFVDFIREGFRIFFSRFKDFSLLFLGTYIPTVLFVVLALISGKLPPQNTNSNIINFLLLCSMAILQVMVSLIVLTSSMIITEGIVENKPASLTNATKLALSKLGRAFTTQLLAFVILLGLSLLLIVPGIIYSFYYIFMLQAVALRDKDGMEALKYSKTLVEGQWWRIFWISIGIGIILSIFNGLITFLPGRVSGNPYYSIIPSLISLYIAGIFGIVVTVLFINVDFVYHRRLAKRKEMETGSRIKRAPSIEEYLKNKQKAETSSVKRSTVKKAARKAEQTKPLAKRSTRKKD